MKGLILNLIASLLWIIAYPIGILYIVLFQFNRLGYYLEQIAIVIDCMGNVFLAPIFNQLIIKDLTYPFGKRKETISSVLGKNQKIDNLTKLGVNLANLLDLIDPNHCIKSIDKTV